MLAHLDAAVDVAGLAGRARMSERTVNRRFRAAVGVSPLAYRRTFRGRTG